MHSRHKSFLIAALFFLGEVNALAQEAPKNPTVREQDQSLTPLEQEIVAFLNLLNAINWSDQPRLQESPVSPVSVSSIPLQKSKSVPLVGKKRLYEDETDFEAPSFSESSDDSSFKCSPRDKAHDNRNTIAAQEAIPVTPSPFPYCPDHNLSFKWLRFGRHINLYHSEIFNGRYEHIMAEKRGKKHCSECFKSFKSMSRVFQHFAEKHWMPLYQQHVAKTQIEEIVSNTV